MSRTGPETCRHVSKLEPKSDSRSTQKLEPKSESRYHSLEIVGTQIRVKSVVTKIICRLSILVQHASILRGPLWMGQSLYLVVAPYPCEEPLFRTISTYPCYIAGRSERDPWQLPNSGNLAAAENGCNLAKQRNDRWHVNALTEKGYFSYRICAVDPVARTNTSYYLTISSANPANLSSASVGNWSLMPAFDPGRCLFS